MKSSYYYKYNFTSPEPLYAKVKEQLKAYFQTGVIDDILFPTYTEDLLKNLGKSSLKILSNIFCLEDYESTLPDNFEGVRELWLVTSNDVSYKMPNACYEQATVAITPEIGNCSHYKYCAPDEIKVTYKTTGTLIQSYSCQYLLKPGNVHAKQSCSFDSQNMHSTADETFDIRGNKIVTNFPSGTLYMTYYVKQVDENEYQMIPDNQRIKDYIEAELMFKCFENIYNNVHDETLKQIEGKIMYYEKRRDEKRVMAEIEIKKQTIERQLASAKYQRNRLNKYNIS